jgi:phosphomevalonate kinase
MNKINEYNYKNNNNNNNKLITSSPGKILLSGGYLIINPNYQGLVLCSKTYFTCEGKIYNNNNNNKNNNNQISNFKIIVNSLNFKKSYFYVLTIYEEKEKEKENSIKEISLNLHIEDIKKEKEELKDFILFDIDNEENKFIYFALKISFYFFLLKFLSKIPYENWREILFDVKKNGNLFVYNLNGDYRFYGFNEIYNNNNDNKIKTGLGSSSALITSLCSNVLLNLQKLFNNENLFNSLNDYSKEIRLLLFIICLEANNQAQNKVNKIYIISNI